MDLEISCNELGVRLSDATLVSAFDQFNGIPKGICSLLKKESKSIDDFFTKLPSSFYEKVNCSRNDYIGTVRQQSSFGKLADKFLFNGEYHPGILDFDLQKVRFDSIEQIYDSKLNWAFNIPHTNEAKDRRLPCVLLPEFKTLNGDTAENRECIEKQILFCYSNPNLNGCKIVKSLSQMRLVENLRASYSCKNDEKSEKNQDGIRKVSTLKTGSSFLLDSEVVFDQGSLIRILS